MKTGQNKNSTEFYVAASNKLKNSIKYNILQIKFKEATKELKKLKTKTNQKQTKNK